MTRSELINQAADYIEEHPEQYKFWQGRVQFDPNAPHCMLARMGQIAGAAAMTGCTEIAEKVLRMGPSEFYRTVDPGYLNAGRLSTVYLPAAAAAGMRKVAKRYEGIPGDVRALFAREQETETV